MAKTFTFLFLILVCSISALFAQDKEDFSYLAPFAVINDPDGYTNIRDDDKHIIGRIYENEIFALFPVEEPIGKYMPVIRKFNSKDEASDLGNIHESRIKYLYEFPLFKRKITDNSAVFEKGNTKITINIGVLDIDDERIVKDREYGYPVEIDGCDVWGADCFSREYPEHNTEIKSIEFTIDGITRQFDKKDISGYIRPSLEHTFVSLGNDNTIYMAMNNGDGAGSYYLLWVLKDNKVVQKSAYIGF